MTASEPIDRTALNAILDATGGDSAFLAEMIDAYLEDAAGLFGAIDGALASGQPEVWRRAAHSLKSNSATFGAGPLSELCREIEARGKAGEIDGLSSLLDAARAEYARVRSVLRVARAEL